MVKSGIEKSLSKSEKALSIVRDASKPIEVKKKKKRLWRQHVRHTAKRLRKEKEAKELPLVDVEVEDVKKKKKRKKKKPLTDEDIQAKLECVKVKKIIEENPTDRLDGSRFRYLNEQLYTTTSFEAKAMFEEDSEAFDAYHKGYRLQVKKWPVNPVDKIILDLATLPTNSVIADVGCGDGKIAQRFNDRFTIHSFDLVARNDCITVANMTNLPLPNESVDVAVYCLSLMGTNLANFFREANRILKIGGKLKICEVASRFRSVKKFTEALEKMGFSLKKKKLLKDYFILMSLTKTEKPKDRRPMGLSLMPCLYKKR